MRRLVPMMAALAVLLLSACGSLEEPTPTARPTRAAVAPTLRPKPTAAPQQPTVNAGQAPDARLIVAADDPRAIGDPSAPITIIEYSDFECPFCSMFVRQTMPALVEQYVKTGVVRFAFRDLPIPSHRSAMTAAIAGRCAAAQDAFWPMHDKLFATHGEEWGGAPSRDKRTMVEFAQELKLDTEAFQACMDDPAVQQQVQAEADQANRLGLGATPSFFINGGLLVGAQPFERFEEIIRLVQQQQ